ncbi:MAG TPA: head decoration protein [Allosphingosinicella sp.]|nr:head decoration protein [Allosphingosinicella sp.]
MTTLTESIHANESFVSEARGERSRAAVTVLSGQNLGACSVLGTVVSGTVASAVKASGANTGNGTFVLDGTTPLLLGTKLGIYTVRFLTTTDVRIEDPDGYVVGDLVIGTTNGNTASVAEQIKGVVTQGSAAFAAGDGFDISVTVIVEKVAQYDPAATNGAQIATGILMRAVDATAADTPGTAYVRDCEHNADIVVWKTGLTSNQIAKGTSDLKRRDIILR